MDKLVLITSSFKTGKGGIASYANDFVSAFFDKFQILVITGDYIKPSHNNDFRIEQFDLNKVDFINARMLLNLIKIEKPSIIINSDSVLFPCILPFIQSNIKVISISHFFNGILAKKAGYNSKYLNNIIALSTYGKLYIERYYKIKDLSKTVVVYNFLHGSDNKNIDHKKDRKILKIVYPGGVAIHKEPIVVAKALYKLLLTKYDFEFYWLGNPMIVGAGWKFVQLKSIIQFFPDDYRIKKMGRVERAESIEIIKAANIFLLPSKGEGCPISLVEAMKYSCVPIISNARHGSLDIIQDNISGLIIPQGNYKLLYEKIVDIIQNHQKYMELYDNSKKRFDTILEKSVWMEKMQNLIDCNEIIIKRDLTFGFLPYIKHSSRMKFIIICEFIKDRFVQLKFFISFRILFIRSKFFLKEYLKNKTM